MGLAIRFGLSILWKSKISNLKQVHLAVEDTTRLCNGQWWDCILHDTPHPQLENIVIRAQCTRPSAYQSTSPCLGSLIVRYPTISSVTLVANDTGFIISDIYNISAALRTSMECGRAPGIRQLTLPKALNLPNDIADILGEYGISLCYRSL